VNVTRLSVPTPYRHGATAWESVHMPSHGPSGGGGEVGEEPFGRPDLMVRVSSKYGSGRLMARDARTGRFAGLALAYATPTDQHRPTSADAEMLNLFALSPDGSRLLAGDSEVGGDPLVVHELTTGTAMALPPGPGGGPVAAAFSGGGDRIAALSLTDEKATVTVLDLAGGAHRVLWSTDGATSSEVKVSFSPDGSFVGVTYVDPDDHDHTVVLDSDGIMVADLPDMAISGPSRLGWTGDHTLILEPEYWDSLDPQPIILVDAATGSRTETAQPEQTRVLGALDGRVIRLTASHRIVSTTFDGTDARPILDAGPDTTITFCDAIPGALTGRVV
jgi:hypothetical protein